MAASEKFNLKKNISVSVVSFLINIGLVFISYKLVIKYDGLHSLGVWSLLFAWASFVKLGDIGMGGAILRFISEKKLDEQVKEIRGYIDTAVVMNMTAFIILTLFGYIILKQYLGDIIEHDFLQKASELLPLMMIGIFFSSMTSVMIAGLQGIHFGYLGSYLSVFGNVLQIICVIVLVPKIGVAGLAWGQLLQYIISTVIGWYLISRKTFSLGMFPTNYSRGVYVKFLCLVLERK